MSSRCLEWKSGFIKFGKNKRWEVNWNVRDWAVPLELCFMSYLGYVRILCVSLYFPIPYKGIDIDDDE